jgi:hypothetical protein
MPHGDLKPTEAPGTNRLVFLTGVVTTSTSGTIDESDCDGFDVVLTDSEAGRYTITLHNKFYSLRYGHAAVELSADTAAVQAKGVVAAIRNVDVAPTVASGDSPTLDLQFTVTPTSGGAGADADVEDGAVIRIFLCMSRGKI